MNGTPDKPAGIETLTDDELTRLANNQELREVAREVFREELSWRRFQEAIKPPPERVFEVRCRSCPNRFEVRLRLPKGVKVSADFPFTFMCKECAGTLEARSKRRMGRGKLVFPVKYRGGNPCSAELDPEATTDQVDQTLTKLSLKGANSDSNAAILREHEQAADRFAHIESGLPAKQRAVLVKVLDVVEPGDSLREIARKAGLHAPQVSRAFDAAREADKRRIFKEANREKRPPAIAYRPYNPRVVPMETVMMPHQGPVLYTIYFPDRIGSHYAAANPLYPPINGCSHPNRQWLQVGFGGLRLACPDCEGELDRAGILSKP